MRGLIDHHLHVHSWLHDWHPTVKLVAYAAAVVAVASVRAPVVAVVAAAFGLLALIAGCVPVGFALRRAAPVLGFLAMFVVLMALGGQAPVGGRVALQCIALLLLTTALLATTPTLQIFRSLRALHVPGKLVELLRLSYRLTFALGDEWHALRTGAACRGFVLSARRKQLHTLGRLAGALLIRGVGRSDRLYDAMLVRGYDGVARALPPSPWQRRDALKLATALGVPAFLVAARWWL